MGSIACDNWVSREVSAVLVLGIRCDDTRGTEVTELFGSNGTKSIAQGA
jgi:hypothetical protein